MFLAIFIKNSLIICDNLIIINNFRIFYLRYKNTKTQKRILHIKIAYVTISIEKRVSATSRHPLRTTDRRLARLIK